MVDSLQISFLSKRTSTKIGWFTTNFIPVKTNIIHDIRQTIKEEKNVVLINIADQLQIFTIHALLLLFQTGLPHPVSFISKSSPPITYSCPHLFFHHSRVPKTRIFATLKLQWHGFIKLFYSRQKFMILSIKEGYLVSVENFLYYQYLLNFQLLSFRKTPTKNYMNSY